MAQGVIRVGGRVWAVGLGVKFHSWCGLSKSVAVMSNDSYIINCSSNDSYIINCSSNDSYIINCRKHYSRTWPRNTFNPACLVGYIQPRSNLPALPFHSRSWPLPLWVFEKAIEKWHEAMQFVLWAGYCMHQAGTGSTGLHVGNIVLESSTI